MKEFVFTLLIFAAFSGNLSGQEHPQENETHDRAEHSFKKHRLAAEFGYAHIPDGYEEEPGDLSVWVPTVGIEYLYRFNHKWAGGLTVSMETGNYLIEVNREDLDRENVLIIAAVADYEIVPRWAVFGGGGMEIERHRNFGLLRVGTAYNFPLKNNWDISPIVTFDYKIEYYTYELVISIGKSF